VIPSEPDQRLPIRALVVDDDPLIQRLLVAFLGARGYSVEQSSDGLDPRESRACDAGRTQRTQRLRRERREQQIPWIFFADSA